MSKIALPTLVLLFLFLTESAVAQIAFTNPSFEGERGTGVTPDGWTAVGTYSTPDILPGEWGVDTKPVSGNTYIGLVVRTDGTNEAIGQKLKQSIMMGECYEFEMALARSDAYALHNQAVFLKIWGSQESGKKQELLDKIGPITHTEWLNYKAIFVPVANYDYIIFEASFTGDTPYAGNVLIDDLSPIVPCPVQ